MRPKYVRAYERGDARDVLNLRGGWNFDDRDVVFTLKKVVRTPSSSAKVEVTLHT